MDKLLTLGDAEQWALDGREQLIQRLGLEGIDFSRLSTLERDNPEQWARYAKAQEDFAKGGEIFMSTGKAPTPELQGLFVRMRNWLLELIEGLRKDFGKLSQDLEDVYSMLLGAPVEIDEQFRENTTVEELYDNDRRLNERIAHEADVSTFEQGGDVIRRTTEEIDRLQDEIFAVEAMIEEAGQAQDAGEREGAQNAVDRIRTLEARKVELETALAYEHKALKEARAEVAQYDKSVKDIKKAEDKERSWRKSFLQRERAADAMTALRDKQREKQRVAKEKARVQRQIKQILKAATSKRGFRPSLAAQFLEGASSLSDS